MTSTVQQGKWIPGLLVAVVLSCVACKRRTDPPPASLPERVDAAVARGVAWLSARQSADGAWRSPVYGTFKNGSALTPLVLRALLSASGSDRSGAIDAGRAWLDELAEHPELLTFPVYAASLAIETRTDTSHWLEVLRSRQLTETLGWSPSDREYGGWGYSTTVPEKPRPGQFAPPLVESNVSATAFALDAIHGASGPLDSVCPAALSFLDRMQNYRDGATGPVDDGGFVFIYDDPVRNKAGPASAPGRFRSYGSVTADGLRSMLMCGRDAKHPRVVAARRWLVESFSGEHHPGDFIERHEPDRDGLYFYWAASIAKTMRQLPRDSTTADWAARLAAGVLERQRTTGDWENVVPTMRENDPVVATALAVTALATLRPLLERPAP